MDYILPFFLPACSKWHHNVYNESIQSMAATLTFWKKLKRDAQKLSAANNIPRKFKKKNKGAKPWIKITWDTLTRRQFVANNYKLEVYRKEGKKYQV